MNNRIILSFLIFYLFVFQMPVLAVDVSQWDGAGQLQASIQAGSDVTLLNDITATGISSVINNTASTTANLSTHFISGNLTTSIFNNTGTLTILNGTLKNVTTTTNNGGAINNSGTLNLTNVNFTSNNATSNKGGAIYNNATGIINMKADGSNISFSGNAANQGSDIYMNGGTLNLNAVNAADNITFSGGIAGTANSTINKNGSGILNLSTSNENSSGFLGTFTQNTGTTNVTGTDTFNTAKFFGGTSNINGGELNFNAGGELVNGSSITLSNSAKLNVYDNAVIGPTTGTGNASITVNNGAGLYLLNANDLNFNASISGSSGGNIYQTGNGTTRYQLSYNNFAGTFTQTAGTSTFSGGFLAVIVLLKILVL